MVKLQAGSIYSSIEVQDNSAKGFRSAQNNIKSFQQSTRELRDRLFPIQNALKGGIFAGASIAGTGAILSNFTIMGTVLQDLAKNVPQMDTALQAASGSTQTLSTEMGGLAQNTETTLQAMIRYGVTLGSISGAAFSLVEAGIRIIPVFSTLRQNIRASYQAWTSTVAMCREYATVCSMAESATELLTAAGFRNITVTQANAAQTLLMTNVEAGSAVVKRMVAACSWANIKAMVAETASKMALGSVTKSVTTWSNLFTVATAKQIVVSTMAAAKNFVVAASLGALGIAAKVAAVGVAALSTAFYLSPFGVVLGAILAAGAAVAWLCGWFGTSTKTTDENSEAMTRNTEVLRANSEAMTKRNELADAFDKTEELRLKRLEQLAAKENKSAAEMREMAKLTEDLNKSCVGLGLTFDETSGTVDGLNKKTAEFLKDQNIRQRIERLKNELKYLQAEANQADTTPERRSQITEQQEKIRFQLKVYEMGYTDDVMGMSEAEYLQKKMDMETEATQNAQKEAQKIRDEALKKQEEAYRNAEETIRNLQRETQQNKQNALENELATLREQTEERKKALQTIIEAKRESGENYAKEAEALQKIQTLEAERITQIRAKHAAEAKKYADDFAASEKERRAQQRQEQQRKAFDELAKNRPMEALQTFQNQWIAAKDAAKESRLEVKKTIQNARADGIVTEEEAAAIQTARQKYQKQLENVNYFQGKWESVRDSIAQEALALQKELTQPTAPLEAFSRGSVEAFKKEKELDGMSQSPETKKLGEIQKLLEKKYARETKVAEETRDFTKKLANSIMGV